MKIEEGKLYKFAVCEYRDKYGNFYVGHQSNIDVRLTYYCNDYKDTYNLYFHEYFHKRKTKYIVGKVESIEVGLSVSNSKHRYYYIGLYNDDNLGFLE